MTGLYAESLSRLDTENAFKIGRHIARSEADGQKKAVCLLNLGQPDFPVPAWIIDEIKHQLDVDNTKYCDPQGLISLRKAIVEHLHKTRGLRYSPDQVVVFPGAKTCIGFSQQAYCNPGDEVIYPSPGYPIFESFVRYVGAKPVPLKLSEKTGFSFSSEQLAGLITPKTKLIFLNFPSNPTGGTITRAALESFSEVILKKCGPNVRVYSDEIYEDILFEGNKHYSIASIPGMEKITIISSGFSKSFAWTGGRVGYAVFPTIEEALVFKNLNINYFSCVSPYNQEGARVALENPKSTEFINTMVTSFQQRRDTAIAALKTIEGVNCHVPQATFYLFPNVEKALKNLGIFDISPAALRAANPVNPPSITKLFQLFALYGHKVAIMDRESFGKIDVHNEPYIRLSTATKESSLIDGIERLKAAFSDKSGFEAFFKDYANFDRP
jgi:aspartate/methionine/tyrosine aminotransferase